MLSKTVFAFSIFLCGLAVALTVGWGFIIQHRDGWLGLGFIMAAAPVFNCLALLLAVFPSAALVARHHRMRDRRSLWLSSGAFALIVAETVALFFTPLHGC